MKLLISDREFHQKTQVALAGKGVHKSSASHHTALGRLIGTRAESSSSARCSWGRHERHSTLKHVKVRFRRRAVAHGPRTPVA